MLGFRPPVSALTVGLVNHLNFADTPQAAHFEDRAIPYLAETLLAGLSLLSRGHETASASASHPCVVAPINQLPFEVIGEIFLWYIQLDENDFHRRHDYVSSLSVVTEVCNLWRTIARSLPVLWSRIVICSPHPRHIVMTRLFLERSRSHPLSIKIQHVYKPTGRRWDYMLAQCPEEHTFTNDIFYLLVPHLHRWKNLTLQFRGNRQPPALMSLCLTAQPAPLLETLDLDVESWDAEHADNLGRTLCSYPSVRHFRWAGIPPTADFTLWNKLTTLDVNFRCFDSCLACLSHCRSLRTLTCSFMQGGPSSIPQHSIILEELDTLRVHTWQPLDPFLDCLTLPRLRSVRLHSNCPVEDPHSLISLLKRSSCQLQKFHYFDLKTLHTEQLYAYFSSAEFAYLGELTVRACGRADGIVELLSRHQNRPFMLPNIRKLVLNVNAPNDSVLRMFASRIDHPAEFRDFRLIQK